MFGFLIALISGALMSIQGVLNTGLTRQTGIWPSAGWVQISAFFTCVVLWLFPSGPLFPPCSLYGPGTWPSAGFWVPSSPGPSYAVWIDSDPQKPRSLL